MGGVSSAWLRDAAERVAWTAVEAGAASAIVAVSPLTAWWVVPLAGVFAAVKSYAAKHVGEKGTAALLPKEPAS